MTTFPKTIVLAATGSIAAYKTPELVRLFKKAGCRVIPVLTQAGQKFVTALTLKSVSGESVITNLFDKKYLKKPVRHIALAEEASLIVIAPATANIIAKLAAGLADDFLTTLVLSATCPILIAPAMNEKMFLNKVTQENIKKLKKLGCHFIGPATGELACGVTGAGRMENVEKIFDSSLEILGQSQDLKGKKILVTAGPTREMIDPVRFISNASSGKMGRALASSARERGAKVTLISGPTAPETTAGIKKIKITSTMELGRIVKKHFPQNQILIMVAAAADFTPEKPETKKIKKEGKTSLKIKLKPAPDILKTLVKKTGQIIVGFSLEAENILANARKKLKEKKLDIIVANQISSKTGFESETNQVIMLDKSGRIQRTRLLPKEKIAHQILDFILKYATSP